jgi:hypothetical protein
MYSRRNNLTGNSSIFLALVIICIHFFMPKSVNIPIRKDVALPVVATLLGVSIVRNLRF